MEGPCEHRVVSLSAPQHLFPDVGLYGPDSVTWRIHGDPAMALAGFRSLLLQAVHPLVMAGFEANTVMHEDPWGRLEPGDGDRYVDEMRVSARLVGLDSDQVPRSEAEIEDYYIRVRPQLRVTSVARHNALWFFVPPMPRTVELATPARPAWAALVGIAAAMLPRWARRLYGLPGLPVTDLTATISGRAVRTALAALPDAWIESPAHRAARERVSALSA